MNERADDLPKKPSDKSSVAAQIEVARRNHDTILDLRYRDLVELPESIGRLPQLEHLNLTGNRLTTLPRFIGNLSRLRRLALKGNELTTLPESIGWLRQLESLDLTDNRLTVLPESIGLLASLEYLYLGGNRLARLPTSLRNLDSLRWLFLHGNDALGLPAEVLGPDWRESARTPAKAAQILEYYFRARDERRPLNEAKLILVGRGGVGKTTVVKRLLHDEFTPGEKKTEGIQITKWPLRLNDKEDVQLNVWDFGGQEIMHATHQFFLTERSLYLLVLNGREGGEEADAEYWLKLIASFGGDSPVVVVLNKIKEHPFDVNRRALQQKYPAVRDFIKTDCADKTGLDDLKRIVERETDQLKHLRDAFPASWFSIKDRLARMEQNYLNFDEYRAVCAELGEKDEKAQTLLASYLHSLGIALNYRDDPRLQDTHVLNPHWVTQGIYKILNAEKLEKQNGEIRLDELAKILDPALYPVQMHRFIFELMKKFDLCFSFPDAEEHFLIPELLDKQEPAATAAFMPEECLNFQYHYPVLPEGLLPRFVVRTHTLSEESPRWRTGVILKFEDNSALVKADVQDRKVFVSVAGPVETRRRLLALIRGEFERIHGDIRNLQPQAVVPLPEYPEAFVGYDELLVLEQKGLKSVPKVVGDDVLTLNVHDLLNGVDLAGRRGPRAGPRPLRVFCSYSHKDERTRLKLETHIKLLQYQGLIEPWVDREIEAGREWEKEITEQLERADIILLLVSADFIASYYCWEKEMTRALERHVQGTARVIPIIVRAVSWQRAPFAKLQVLPKDGKAVETWRPVNTAWRNVSEGIERVVEEMRGKPGR